MSEQHNPENTSSFEKNNFSDSTARKRLEFLFDPDTFAEIGELIHSDSEPVELVCGYGLVRGTPVYAFSQGGAIGEKHVYKMKKIYDLALKTGTPLVGIYDSQGLHLSQGVKVLDDCGELIFYQNNLSGVVPQISVILGTCVGSNAVLACSADYVIMSKDASFYSTPPTSYTKEDISLADAVAQAGVAHILTDDEEKALDSARQLLLMHPLNFETPTLTLDFDDEDIDTKALNDIPAELDNLDIDEIFAGIFDKENHLELLSDFGTGVSTSMETVQGTVCGVVFTKGGAITADDAVKIARMVSVWDSYNIPVITMVNTTGLAELGASSARDFAKVAQIYAEATTPKITLIIGRAYGSGYIALASRATNSDYTAAWPSAIISALAPKTAVAFLEGGRITTARSREALEEEYLKTKASALNAAREGIIDDIIEPSETRNMLLNQLLQLSCKHVEKHSKKHSNIPF